LSEVGEDLIAGTLRTVGLPEAVLPEPNEHRRVAVESRIDLGLAELHVARLGSFFYCTFYSGVVVLRVESLGRHSEHRNDLVYRRSLGDLRDDPCFALLGDDHLPLTIRSGLLALEDADIVLAILVLHQDIDSAILSDCGHRATS